MTDKVYSVESHVSIAEAAALMEKQDIGSLPVIESEKLIGILTDRDIVTRAVSVGKSLQTATVQQVMSPDVITCSGETSLEEASSLMAQKQIRRLPVVNDDYQISGIISLGDISVRGSAEKAGEALNSISQPK